MVSSAPVPRNATQPWKVLAITSLAVFAASLDSTVLFVAFADIERAFADVSATQLSLVLNAYIIVYAALLVPAGRVADLFGRRSLFLTGVVLFTGASVLCGLAPNVPRLIAARVLQAVGGAILTPTALALVLSEFPKEKRASAVSLWGAVGALAAAVGPSLGSALIELASWRWAFYVNVPICLVAVLAGVRVLSESRSGEKTALPDLLGTLLRLT